jgi:uncharacterized protein (UPF0332 family)
VPEIIDAYLTKANESLESAKDDLSQRRYNSCASRAYYSCYQASVALLTNQGKVSKGARKIWKHEAIQAQIAMLIRRKKVLPSLHKRTLPTLLITRLEADYKPQSITKREAKRSLQTATDFVRLVLKEVSS